MKNENEQWCVRLEITGPTGLIVGFLGDINYDNVQEVAFAIDEEIARCFKAEQKWAESEEED